MLPLRDPIRFAEQTAALDVFSDGRAEIGISLGYQPREIKILGPNYSTVMDNEKNRMMHEENLEILLKAWTEDVMSYDGKWSTLPPSYTKWHHRMTKDYFDDEVSEYDSEEILHWQEGDMYDGSPHPAVAGGTKLKKFSVFPQPLQDPYPQIWQPIFSPQSASWVTQQGFNTAAIGVPPDMAPEFMDVYYDAAEEAGWPHRLDEHDGEPLKYGWDEEKDRGFAYISYFFNTDVHDDETFERWKRGMEHTNSHYSNFALAGMLADLLGGEPGDYINNVVTIDEIHEAEMAFAGDTEELTDQILSIGEQCGYEDFHLGLAFEAGGLTAEEENEQLEHFMEHIAPTLEEKYPGA